MLVKTVDWISSLNSGDRCRLTFASKQKNEKEKRKCERK